jgi:hypothetical protein
MAKCRTQGGIRLGKPDITPDAPGHIRGVKPGNKPGNYEKEPGHLPDGRSTARRSTGINAKDRDPIMAIMPNLSPP